MLLKEKILPFHTPFLFFGGSVMVVVFSALGGTHCGGVMDAFISLELAGWFGLKAKMGTNNKLVEEQETGEDGQK